MQVPWQPRTSSMFNHILSHLEKKWHRNQVGYQGSFSVERLKLFDLYCRETSRIKAILVCLFTPFPPLLLAVLIECLPLQSPSEGWAANWMFWIRVSSIVLLIAMVGSYQVNIFVPGYNLTRWRIVIGAVGVSTLQVGTYILEAAYFGFPVPFLFQFGAITMGIYVPIVSRIVDGPEQFTKTSPIYEAHIRFLKTFIVHMALMAIYPLCRVLYDFIPLSYRGIVIIFVSLWKFAAKHFTLRMVRDLEDFIPELVALSVDFFSALFVSVCMSTSGSFHLTALFIVVDLVYSLLKFRELYKSEKIIRQLIQDRRSMNSRLSSKLKQMKSAGLVTMLLEIIHNSSSYRVTSLNNVRLWASPPHVVPENLYKELLELETCGLFRGPRPNIMRISSSETTTRPHFTPWKKKQIAVFPAPRNPHPSQAKHPTLSKVTTSRHRSTEPSTEFIQHGLQLLFHCEYLVLVEYVECIVPFIFVTYKSILEQLPNIVYFPGGYGHWGTSAAINLVVFGLLEVGSLVLLHAFILRKFGFSPLYQLAFVLETQFSAVQAHLFPVMVCLLQYQIAHLGADFTFRFEWLQNPKK